ncbi:hypothetical protein KC357_g39 [Hortaea werneckii]|nr:hypothetical protein KC357_g39 [Hortaea werneckii]
MSAQAVQSLPAVYSIASNPVPFSASCALNVFQRLSRCCTTDHKARLQPPTLSRGLLAGVEPKRLTTHGRRKSQNNLVAVLRRRGFLVAVVGTPAPSAVQQRNRLPPTRLSPRFTPIILIDRVSKHAQRKRYGDPKPPSERAPLGTSSPRELLWSIGRCLRNTYKFFGLFFTSWSREFGRIQQPRNPDERSYNTAGVRCRTQSRLPGPRNDLELFPLPFSPFHALLQREFSPRRYRAFPATSWLAWEEAARLPASARLSFHKSRFRETSTAASHWPAARHLPIFPQALSWVSERVACAIHTAATRRVALLALISRQATKSAAIDALLMRASVGKI